MKKQIVDDAKKLREEYPQLNLYQSSVLALLNDIQLSYFNVDQSQEELINLIDGHLSKDEGIELQKIILDKNKRTLKAPPSKKKMDLGSIMTKIESDIFQPK